jgi:hypothetical protein
MRIDVLRACTQVWLAVLLPLPLASVAVFQGQGGEPYCLLDVK